MKSLKTICLLLLFVPISLTYAQPQKTAAADPYVKIETNLGTMVFRLSSQTPKHQANFIQLVKKGYFNIYDFNRVIKGFVIQGGETDSAYAAMEKAGETIKRLPAELNETLFHQKGALAAGRDDNKDKASFLGQLYVVDGKKYTDAQLDAIEKRIGKDFHFSAIARKTYKEIGGTPTLDQNYTVFGQLVKGWEVLELIASAPKNKADQPLKKITMKVTLLSKKEIKVLEASIGQ